MDSNCIQVPPLPLHHFCDHPPPHLLHRHCDHPHHCPHPPHRQCDHHSDHHHDYVDQYRVSGGSGGSGGEGTNGGGLSYRVNIIINMNIRMIIGLIMNIIINMRRMIMRIRITIWIIKLVKMVVLVNDNDNRDRLCPQNQNRATGEVDDYHDEHDNRLIIL